MRLTLYCGIVILGVVATGCVKPEKVKHYPDPIAEIFWGRNVRMMVAYDTESPSITDTTIFDSLGNMIELKKFWFHEKRCFDSLHFITRKLSEGEQISNFAITYSFDKNQLIQTWSRINHHNWDFNQNDINPETKFTIEFQLNKNGNIVKETDKQRGSLTTYFYDKDGSLLSKETLSLEDQSSVEKWIYQYENRQLTKADYFVRNDLMMQYFCSETGLIDSSVYKKNVKILYRYQFDEKQ